MKIANEYSAINSTHDDIKGTQQQQQQDGINAVIFDGEKLLQRTWMMMLTVGMLFLSLNMSGQTKFFATDGVVSDSLRNLYRRDDFPGCMETKVSHNSASCPLYFYLREVKVNEGIYVSNCCPLLTNIPQMEVSIIFDKIFGLPNGPVNVPMTATTKDLEAAIELKVGEVDMMVLTFHDVQMNDIEPLAHYNVNKIDNVVHAKIDERYY